MIGIWVRSTRPQVFAGGTPNSRLQNLLPSPKFYWAAPCSWSKVMNRLPPIVVIIAAAVMVSSPAWADAEAVKNGTFDSNGALDTASLGDIRTGIAPVPGRDDAKDLRRKTPHSADADPLEVTRGAKPFSGRLNLGSSPFNSTVTRTGANVIQQNQSAATN